MRMPKLRFLSQSSAALLLALALVLPEICHSAPSAFGLRRDGKLDQSTLNKAYKESDWDQVTQALEGYLRRNGDSKVSVEERIFAYKYLGVIYAADSLSRSKAESYFTRLLNLSPDESIVDLYPSKRVKDLFQDVRNEKEELSDYARRRGAPADGIGVRKSSGEPAGDLQRDSMPSFAARNPAREPVPIQRRPTQSQVKESKSTWVWWTVGIAAAAGAGAGAYYLSSREPEKTTETTIITPK
jgi:hypothetical protein